MYVNRVELVKFFCENFRSLTRLTFRLPSEKMKDRVLSEIFSIGSVWYIFLSKKIIKIRVANRPFVEYLRLRVLNSRAQTVHLIYLYFTSSEDGSFVEAS